jgi:hypothetical protein
MSHRILIVGAGSIGERHLRCMQAEPLCTLAEARASLRVNQAILASALEARPLTEVHRD